MLKQVVCCAAAVSLLRLASAQDVMTLTRATYASDNGRACDARGWVETRCEGQPSCDITASNDICGDPDHGHRKTLRVEWKCGPRYQEARATEGSRVRLSCAGSDPQVMVLSERIELPGAKRTREGTRRLAIPSGYEFCRDGFVDLTKSPGSTYQAVRSGWGEIVLKYRCPGRGANQDSWMTVVYSAQLAKPGSCPAGW